MGDTNYFIRDNLYTLYHAIFNILASVSFSTGPQVMFNWSPNNAQVVPRWCSTGPKKMFNWSICQNNLQLFLTYLTDEVLWHYVEWNLTWTSLSIRVADLLAKSAHFRTKKKWHFEWPNQNSKTTFIVQTFPKYGLYDFYLVNLSLLGAILAIFQFCGFSGLFWPFFPCK